MRRKPLIHEAWDAWSFAAMEVELAFDAWRSAAHALKAGAFEVYRAALDREEQAASLLAVHASVSAA
jgi:hypothetical protein